MNDFKLIKNKFDKNEKDYMKKYKKYDIQKGGSGNSIQIKDNYYLRIRDINETGLIDYLYDKNVYNPELPKVFRGKITEKSNEEKRRGKVLLISEIPFYHFSIKNVIEGLTRKSKPHKLNFSEIKINKTIINSQLTYDDNNTDFDYNLIIKQLLFICENKLLIDNFEKKVIDGDYFLYSKNGIIPNENFCNNKYFIFIERHKKIIQSNVKNSYFDGINDVFEYFYMLLINNRKIGLQYQDNLYDLNYYRKKFDIIYNIYNYYLNHKTNNVINVKNIQNYLKKPNLKNNTQINRIYFFALDDLYIVYLINLITAEQIDSQILNSFILQLAYKEKRIFILISLSIIKEINLSEDSFSLPPEYKHLESKSIENIKEYFIDKITPAENQADAAEEERAEKQNNLTTFYEYYDTINILFSQKNEDANEAAVENTEEAEEERAAAEKADEERAEMLKELVRVTAPKKVSANEADAEKAAAKKTEEERAAAKKAEEERAAAQIAAAKKAAADKAAENAAAAKKAADKAAENAAAAKKAEEERIAAEKAEEERIAAEKAAANQAALSNSRMNYFMSLLNVDDLYNDIPVIYKKWEFLNSEEKKIICEINELKTKQVWNENVENNFQSLKEKYCTNSYSKSEYNKIIKKLLILGITPNIYCSTFHYTIKDNFFLKGNQLSDFIKSIIDDSTDYLNLKYCRLENSPFFYEDFSNLPIQSIKLPITIYFYNQDDHDALN